MMSIKIVRDSLAHEPITEQVLNLLDSLSMEELWCHVYDGIEQVYVNYSEYLPPVVSESVYQEAKDAFERRDDMTSDHFDSLFTRVMTYVNYQCKRKVDRSNQNIELPTCLDGLGELDQCVKLVELNEHLESDLKELASKKERLMMSFTSAKDLQKSSELLLLRRRIIMMWVYELVRFSTVESPAEPPAVPVPVPAEPIPVPVVVGSVESLILKSIKYIRNFSAHPTVDEKLLTSLESVDASSFMPFYCAHITEIAKQQGENVDPVIARVRRCRKLGGKCNVSVASFEKLRTKIIQHARKYVRPPKPS
jgi:hypothetical protein